MRVTAIVGLLLVILLVALSSYLRLDHSGIGCTPWPDCYGNIGEQRVATLDGAYERLISEAREPMSWARPMHRLVASILGLLVLGLTATSVVQKRDRALSFTLLGLTVFLAWLGIYSEGLHSPAIVMGNLCGGFAMLGIFGRLAFNSGDNLLNCRHWVTAAIAMLCLQIIIGGLTSANFAAGACTTLPHCNGSWLPGAELLNAVDLTRAHEIDSNGFVIVGAEGVAIHQLHRIFAVFVVAVILTAAIMAMREERRYLATAIFVCFVVLAELSVGVAAVKTNIPIGAAVAHNWLAGLLLLGLLRLNTK